MWRLFFPRLQLSPTMSICYFIYITRIQSKNKKKKSSTVQISYTEESIWGVLLTLLQAAEGRAKGQTQTPKGRRCLAVGGWLLRARRRQQGKGQGCRGEWGRCWLRAAGLPRWRLAPGKWQPNAGRPGRRRRRAARREQGWRGFASRERERRIGAGEGELDRQTTSRWVSAFLGFVSSWAARTNWCIGLICHICNI
jgi:hypothetical protein